MKVLFVNNFRQRGGGEEFLRDLLPGLAARGIGVDLVCRPGTPLEAMFRGTAVRVHPRPWSPAAAPASLVRVTGLMRRERYDIVNVQRGHDLPQTWLAARLSGRRPVLVYTPQVPEFPRSRLLLGRVDRVVTISRHIAERLAAFMPEIAGRVTIIHYGIDLGRFEPAAHPRGTLRRRHNVPDGTPLIGTVGDLWKNQIEFLDAFVEIRRALGDARYVLVASAQPSPQVSAFTQRAAALGLGDSVIWAGRLPKEEMPALYADLDVAVSTYRNEGFGIWILEALAMSVPVVAFDAGGVRDSLEGCGGGALVAGGARDLARELIDVLRDAGRRRRMGAAGRAWVAARFERDRMVRDYHDYFAAVAGGRG